MGNPGKNNVFVSSRGGGPAEQSRTKQESIKHQNPEYFKRQTDRKMMDGGPGSGPKEGGALQGRATPASKAAALALNRSKESVSHRQQHTQNLANVRKTGEGLHGGIMLKKSQVGKDQAPFQMKQFSKGTMY